MKKINFRRFLIYALILLSSCTHYYYAPNSTNIPLFKEKNTFNLKADYGGDDYKGGDIQMAYSATPKIGVMVNSFFAGKTENVQNNLSEANTHEESGKGSYIEAGVGYYKPLGEQKVWIFETYGGAGVGGENHTYANYETSKLHLTKYFIQPSIGYSSKSGRFEAGLSSRFSDLNLRINQNNVTFETNNSEKQSLDSISLHPSSFLWEPSLIIAAGWPNFKFYLQVTTSENLSNPYLAMDGGNISFGIKFNFKKNPDSKSD